ncbi:phosphotransferase [Myceligenerans pegani]|uniref:Phosphotransferase n=1 Tax=Myceligenerans pegani TaxID=2776917 RepID=A0ABR9N608_9MICO|nr:phosphotransferase [Myceligenerans sp. TRM 65318]MBE1878711.1 phosphotransferase [Myceligenerans sp. TRM 65318]MBE3020982.1 phosphotransferase [Myceligenerans sp. TRM 65318]
MSRWSWHDLPEAVRRAVEAECGTVLHTTAPEAGRNSMFAAVLDTSGGPVFCKGVRLDDQQARAHRHEIHVNQRLREITAHVPRLLWTVETDHWLLAGYTFVPGRHADLSPGSPDIPAVAGLISHLAEELTPGPVPDVAPLARKHQRFAGWEWLADRHADALDPWEKQHLDRLIRADLGITEALDGHSLVHGDVHELNLMVTDGQASLVDWAWARTGPAWVDATLLTIRLIAAGHDPADAGQLVVTTWGMRQPDTSAAAVTTFAASTYGMWRRLAVEHPSPHRDGPVQAARTWTQHRITT